MTQIPLSPAAGAEHPQADLHRNDNTREIVSDVAYRQLAIVNVVFVGRANAGDGSWVLVDAGIPGSARRSGMPPGRGSGRTADRHAW